MCNVAHPPKKRIGTLLVESGLITEEQLNEALAAQKEQESYELYRNLAGQNTGEARDLLEAMAKDELRHKNLVEGWYEEIVYQEF